MAEDPPEPEASAHPSAATRAQAVQRLQIGLFGLGAMVLLIGLANIIMNQALEAEAQMVPEAAPTVAPSDTPAAASDPLADAGVGPDLPAEAIQAPAQQLQPQPPAPQSDASPATGN